MHHVDLEPEVLQAARGLEPEEPPSDDGRAPLSRGIAGNFSAVVKRSEYEHSRFALPYRRPQTFHRRDEGHAARRDEEPVVGLDDPVVTDDLSRRPMDIGDTHSGVEGDLVVLVPGERIEKDLALVRRSVEHLREKDPVV